MNSSVLSYSDFSSLDLYYVSVSSNIFLYGYIIMLIIGFTGNICQILTFSRKTLRNISTGILFLALSISDTIYLLLSLYVLIIYGFHVPDQSNYAKNCQFRHFTSYLSTNFSAWMLTTISCDRWIRSQFPIKAQQICSPRTIIYLIIIVLFFVCLLYVHLLTPMFGQIAPGITTYCGADKRYLSYSYFYNEIFPVITILIINIIPASCMIFFLVGITINIHKHRNRIVPLRQINLNQQEKRRARFLHRQMLILMIVTLMLFFLTTFPVALLEFTISTLHIQVSFAFYLLLISILDFITILNYSLNFYFHCLTSKLFRKEFLKWIPCSISITFRNSNHAAIVPNNQR
ncbi:unnamed protein product [Rotaria sp. Silwood1]|nr:unnamed protein product [Rotaria sp. Silwood1]CAF1312733.1 unnamed protein product [Rotaria sp. Silwood1]CAF3601215.1 unnamed protein product [Rotaria sp. Silwood1]CAF4577293.1 unnamed protein product [Rotaria sp. Silwood1]